MAQKRKVFSVRLDEQDLSALRKQSNSFKPRKSLQQHIEGILITHLDDTHKAIKVIATASAEEISKNLKEVSKHKNKAL